MTIYSLNTMDYDSLGRLVPVTRIIKLCKHISCDMLQYLVGTMNSKPSRLCLEISKQISRLHWQLDALDKEIPFQWEDPYQSSIRSLSIERLVSQDIFIRQVFSMTTLNKVPPGALLQNAISLLENSLICVNLSLAQSPLSTKAKECVINTHHTKCQILSNFNHYIPVLPTLVATRMEVEIHDNLAWFEYCI
jgi:hypothetical protein